MKTTIRQLEHPARGQRFYVFTYDKQGNYFDTGRDFATLLEAQAFAQILRQRAKRQVRNLKLVTKEQV